ncbi:putative transposase [Streptomyces sp. EAS-AB2608]|nr:putative transposase [Streptomyces sp. EAS-AB2608]CUW32229.1 hypothetical protein TUE45_06978 [Streptomyces reticuli]
MLVVTREGDRCCKPRPSQRALVALVYLREHTTWAKIAAGFGIRESTAHAYTTAIVGLLAERAPGLLKTLREAAPDFLLLDGRLAECDRGGDGRADSHKHRRHGVNVQVVTNPGSRLLWLSFGAFAKAVQESWPRAVSAASTGHLGRMSRWRTIRARRR